MEVVTLDQMSDVLFGIHDRLMKYRVNDDAAKVMQAANVLTKVKDALLMAADELIEIKEEVEE